MTTQLASVAAQARPSLEGVLSVEPDPSGCITEPLLRARVQRWLRSVPPLLPADLQLRVATDPVRYRVERAGQVVAERNFEQLPAACSDRLDAVAVALAVALDHLVGQPPQAATEAPSEASTEARPVLESPPSAEPTAPAAALLPEPEAAEPGPRYALFAHGGVLFEPLPAPVFGFGAGFELALDPVSFALGALATAETDTALAGGRSEAQLVGGQVRACLPWSIDDLELAACAGCAGGAVLARGRDYATQRSAAMGWIAPFLRVSARYPARNWLSVRVALDGLLNVLRPELQVRGAPTADRTGLLGAAGSIELVVALP